MAAAAAMMLMDQISPGWTILNIGCWNSKDDDALGRSVSIDPVNPWKKLARPHDGRAKQGKNAFNNSMKTVCPKQDLL
jgi:hypothetical protein